MLNIETESNRTEFAPGETIRGRCGWDLTEAPKDAALRLLWYTEGRGTQDIGVINEHPLTARSISHQEDFEFTLPDGPYSFSGTLISLRWALELSINDGKEAHRLSLLVSPWQTEVTLQEVKA